MTHENNPGERLVIVANRLPVVLKQDDYGEWELEPGSGGLITALAPVLKDRGGMWIGWPGAVTEDGLDVEKLLAKPSQRSGYLLKPVLLTAEERNNFYHGFSNEIIWPMFHDLQNLCRFEPQYWTAYKEVNRKFAEAVARHSRDGDYIWVHDYHLMNVAQELKALGMKSSIGFFLHIPFPPMDIFVKLPWRLQILSGLLDFDLIGFQSLRDRRNFLQCVEHIVPEAKIEGNGQVVTVRLGEREIRVGSFPISIDFNEFARHAATHEVAETAWYIHEAFPNLQIILGVDRLDYTKGIPHRLKAFRRALERFPDLSGKVTLVQIVVPSREDISEYHDLKVEIDNLVGEINGQFTVHGWVPVHYLFRSISRTELLAYYRTAEIALITPLKDGINLVAKEYCAANVEERGTLILSEFAGAAAQLYQGALLVNPYDIEGLADAIYQACQMDEEERRSRMRPLRESVRQTDIFWWLDSFLRAAIAKDLSAFPLAEEFVPRMEVTN